MEEVLKYVDTKVVFQELPDHITLAINISKCPCACPGCHSSYLAGDIGEVLDEAALDKLIAKNDGIDAVCFMGGDLSPAYVNQLAYHIRKFHPDLTVGWYSGRQALPSCIRLAHFDFIKLGPYTESLGPLNSKTTNQRLYRVVQGSYQGFLKLEDITAETFWKKSI